MYNRQKPLRLLQTVLRQATYCLFLVITLTSWAKAIDSTRGFDQERGCLVSGDKVIPLTVEVAVSTSQQRQGLMAREALPENTGMLFRYKRIQAKHQGFWMYNTLIPLDIAFLDSKGNIKVIQTMQPCKSKNQFNCPVYRAGVKFRSALEVNQGFFERHGIRLGDRLVVGATVCGR